MKNYLYAPTGAAPQHCLTSAFNHSKNLRIKSRIKRVLEVTASVAESTLSIPIPGGGLLDNSIFFFKPLGSKVLIKLKASFQ